MITNVIVEAGQRSNFMMQGIKRKGCPRLRGYQTMERLKNIGIGAGISRRLDSSSETLNPVIGRGK